MESSNVRFAAVFALLSLSACGDDAGESTRQDGGGDANADVAFDAAAEANPPPLDARPIDAGDTNLAPDGGPPSMQTPTFRRVFGPDALFNSEGTCSLARNNGKPVWCAFTVPGAAVGTFDLWVMNIKQTPYSDDPCGDNNPACYRLAKSIWPGLPPVKRPHPYAPAGPVHPFAPRFETDTLIYYTKPPINEQAVHEGPIFAWRPGDSDGPQQISSDRGLFCRTSGYWIYCLDDAIGDPAKPESVQLRMGSSPALISLGLLPALERFHPFRSDGVVDWEVLEPGGGGIYFLSSPDPGPTTAVMRVGYPAQPTHGEVARDVHGLVANGLEVYYLDRLGPKGSGNLWSRRLPDLVGLGDPVQIADRVLALAGPVHPLYFTLHREGQNGPEYQARVKVPDKPVPALKTVFAYVEKPELIVDGDDHTLWISHDFVGEVVRHSDLARCQLATKPTAKVFNVGYVTSSLIYWTEGESKDQKAFDLYFAPLDDCRAATLKETGVPNPVQGLGVFGADYDDRDQTVTLKAVGFDHRDSERRVRSIEIIAERVSPDFKVITDGPSIYVLIHSTVAGRRPPGTYVLGPIDLNRMVRSF